MWHHGGAGGRGCVRGGGNDHSGGGSDLRSLNWGCCHACWLSTPIVDRVPIYTDIVPINGIPILGFWSGKRNSAQR